MKTYKLIFVDRDGNELTRKVIDALTYFDAQYQSIVEKKESKINELYDIIILEA